MPKAFLAIDLGAESGRAIVGLYDGGRVELHEVHRFPHRPLALPAGLHWNLGEIWTAILVGIRRGVELTAGRGLRLESIGVDTWGVDFALLGRSGDLLGLPRCYRDERSTRAFERTVAQLGRSWLYAATGIEFLRFNTLYQLVALRDHEPRLLDAAERLLFMPDLMHYLLCGTVAVETTIASTSQMRDARTRDWAWPLLDRLELPRRLFSRPTPAAARIGPLRADVTRDTGCPPDVQVVLPAAHDTASAVAAIPAEPGSRWCFISSGTWSPFGAELDEPCLTDAARDAPFTNEAGLGGTVRFLTNLPGLWMVQQCRQTFEQRANRPITYEELMRAAEQAEPLRTLVDPADPAFAAPGDMPARLAAAARRSGQPEPAAPGEAVRCCLESLALSYRFALERLERVLGQSFDVLHIVGGGSRNDLLNQMAADATGRRVVAGPEEATATGNVMVQALAAGCVLDRHAIRSVVRDSARCRVFEPREPGQWARAGARMRELRSAPLADGDTRSG